MKKRRFLQVAMAGAAGGAGATSPVHAQHAPRAASGPVLLTVSGFIGSGNRGPLDPALDQMMAKQNVTFAKAHAFDFAALASLPAVIIRPTLEYDQRRHTLKGPLLAEVMKACGVKANDRTSLHLRAVDGYAVLIPWPEVIKRRFVMATHLDERPMTLGGLGPLWAVYDADAFADMAAKSVSERFALCPWATYHIDVREV
jgi:hypothetical protein